MSGRALAAEVLVATPAVRNLIREGKIYQIYSLMQTGGKFGMITMDQHLAQLVNGGKVTMEAALERCSSEDDLRRLARPGAGAPGVELMTTTFAYKVRDQSGKLVEGQLDAEDATLVVGKLRQMGYTPIAVEAKHDNKLKADIKIPGLSGRVKLKDVAVFSRQFATMINSGLSLIRSLAILAEQTENEELGTGDRRGAPRRREGRLALGRDLEAPEGLQPALHRDGALR